MTAERWRCPKCGFRMVRLHVRRTSLMYRTLLKTKRKKAAR